VDTATIPGYVAPDADADAVEELEQEPEPESEPEIEPEIETAGEEASEETVEEAASDSDDGGCRSGAPWWILASALVPLLAYRRRSTGESHHQSRGSVS